MAGKQYLGGDTVCESLYKEYADCGRLEMSLKPDKKSDLNKGWMKKRRDKPIRIQPEYDLIVKIFSVDTQSA